MFVGAHLLEAPTTNLAQGVRGETSDLLTSRTLGQILFRRSSHKGERQLNLTQGVRGETSDLLASRTLSQILKKSHISFLYTSPISYYPPELTIETEF